MYLHELLIRNNGPIRNLHLNLTFSEEGNPIPHIIVGRNGTGKTNLLSLVGDALMEGAESAYDDILTRSGKSRNYFRILGGKTITYGESGSYSIFRFEHEDTPHFYHEATATINPEEVTAEISASLAAGASWEAGKSSKRFEISAEVAREIYGRGIYAFFPSSRSEHPFWFNRDALDADVYEDRDRYTSNLDRPLFVEHGVDAFAQWLLGAITESRLDVADVNFVPDNRNRVTVELDTTSYLATQRALLWANQIIQIILDDPSAKFFWAGRRNSRKVGVSSGGKPLIASLDGLSGGQSTLLAIFGTILRYGDEAGKMEGVVIIDELDAHMHIDLQMKALPRLMRLFPRVQFIVSSHSPLFALGMEQNFSPTGVRMLEMPSGQPMHAEGYQEFEHALVALRETQAFANAVREQVMANEAPTVLLAGETDLLYFQTAARLLGFDHLVDHFAWIGQTNGGKGGKNTGDNALNSALNFLMANPEFTTRTIIAVYDCDANKADEKIENIHIIALPKLADRKAKKGVENMLPNWVFTDDFYKFIEVDYDYGGTWRRPELMKMKLCQSLCGDDAAAETFYDFRPILERIDCILSEGGGSDQPTSDVAATA